MQIVEKFETVRLRAEPICEHHGEDLCRMHRDAQVMATLGGVRSNEVTQEFLRASITHWQRHGFGLWMLYDREGGSFVGRGGIRHFRLDGQDHFELAYALTSEFWGQGLATEFSRRCVELGFQQLGLTELIALTLRTNRASQRVMEKVGFSYERDLIYETQPHVLYRLQATAVNTRPADHPDRG